MNRTARMRLRSPPRAGSGSRTCLPFHLIDSSNDDPGRVLAYDRDRVLRPWVWKPGPPKGLRRADEVPILEDGPDGGVEKKGLRKAEGQPRGRLEVS